MTATEDNTELFIETVKENPIIYDLKNKDYKNFQKKDKMWDSIGPVFQMDGDTAKKKWKNLRDTYAKYLKSLNTTSGQAAKKYYGNWQWADQMKFLKPHLAFAKALQHLNSPSENENIDQISTQNVAVDNNYEYEYNCNHMHDYEYAEPETQLTVSNTEIIPPQLSPISNAPPAAKRSFGRKRSQAQMDDLEHIFMGYAKSIKKLSRRRQTIIKLRVAEIIAEQEMAEIDENTPCEPSSAPNVPNTSAANNSQPITDSNTEMT